MLKDIIDYVLKDPGEVIAVISAMAALVATGIKSFNRRPKKTSQGGAFLTHSELLTPPMARPAYSDRMSYILAELSALAYFRFEDSEDGTLQLAIEKFRELKGENDTRFDEMISEVLKEYQDDLLLHAVDSKKVLAEILKKADFELVDTINVGTTQGFACKRVKEDETPYLVIAYRGTELELQDWLTDANAVPAEGLPKDIKVHKGFWQALHDKPGATSQSVLERVTDILSSNDARHEGQVIPCFITGHSLGGALALLTTREVAADINGACYTYGAPRVANYEYFANMKTPVYRVVNSSDIVPRVPPGAGMGVLLKLVQALSWTTQFIPGLKEPLEWLEQKIDELNGYRHHGDQRYLTDMKSNNFKELHLLSNPPLLDRVWWMWQHIRKSLWEPVNSHGMAIYRHKLLHIAQSRNQT